MFIFCIFTVLQGKTSRTSRSSVSPMKPAASGASGSASGGVSVTSDATMVVKMDLMVPYISCRLRNLTNENVMDEMANSAPTWSTVGTASKSLGGTVIATIKNKIEEGIEVISFLSFTILNQHIAHCTGHFEARLYKPEGYEEDDSFLFIQIPTSPDDLKLAITYVTTALEIQNGYSESRTQYYRASKVSMEKEMFRVYAIKFEGVSLHNDLLQSDADMKKDGGLTVRTTTRPNTVAIPGFEKFEATVLDVSWEVPFISDETFDVEVKEETHVSTTELVAQMAAIKLKIDNMAKRG